MTPPQFDALAKLLRLREGPAREVARLVLVQGLSTPDAARAAGLEYRAAFGAVQRAQRGVELARQAIKAPESSGPAPAHRICAGSAVACLAQA